MYTCERCGINFSPIDPLDELLIRMESEVGNPMLCVECCKLEIHRLIAEIQKQALTAQYQQRAN